VSVLVQVVFASSSTLERADGFVRAGISALHYEAFARARLTCVLFEHRSDIIYGAIVSLIGVQVK
jgi:hypothetical protein